jgi:malate dehydrogenase (oxaloacetate-decarboxylating)
MEGPCPLVLPLSNPTALAECTPDQAREWSGGLARVATGSPFPDTAQCNNVYVFPGLGLGVLLARARLVTTAMLAAAAETVAAHAPADLLLPPLASIRSVSRAVALAVAAAARREGVARLPEDVSLEERLADLVWDPSYVRYRLAR